MYLLLYGLMCGIIGVVIGLNGISPTDWEWWVIVFAEIVIWICGNERGEHRYD